YPGKRLGRFRPKLEQIFRAITEANDILSDDKKREEYAYKTAQPDERAKLEARKIEDELRAEERRSRLQRRNPLIAAASRVADLIRRGKEEMQAEQYAAAANDFLLAASLD